MAKSFSISRLQTNVKENWALLIILAIAAVVRYWGIGFGQPHHFSRPDEWGIIKYASNFLTGDLNPRYFVYPTFYMYIVSVVFLIYYLIGLADGRFTMVSDFFWEHRLAPTNAHLMIRCVSAFFGVMTIIVVYKLGKRLWGKRVGLIAALYLSLAAMHVRDSHFGMTDIANTFWIILAFLYIVKTYQDQSFRNYIISGILVGLSVATKYMGIILSLPMTFVHINGVIEQHKERITSTNELKSKKHKQKSKDTPPAKLKIMNFLDKRIVGFYLALGAAFLTACPYLLPELSLFLKEFNERITEAGFAHYVTYNGVKQYFLLGRGWWYHARYSLPYGFGWSLYLLFVFGVITLIRKNYKLAFVLLSFPLVLYSFVGKGYTVFIRHIVPLSPFICVIGAFATDFVYKWIISNYKLADRKEIIALASVLIILPSAYNVVQSDRLLAKKDNRVLAQEWVNKNLPEGSTIYQAGMSIGWANLWLHPDYRPMINQFNNAAEKPKELIMPIKYIKDNKIIGYNQLGYDYNRKQFSYNNRLLNILPQYIITRESPLVKYDHYSDSIRELLKNSYTLIKKFVAVNIHNKDNWYNKLDDFYLPFNGFKEIQRPGPNVYIYQLKNNIKRQ